MGIAQGAKVVAIILTRDVTKAKPFEPGILGFPLIPDDGFATLVGVNMAPGREAPSTRQKCGSTLPASSLMLSGAGCTPRPDVALIDRRLRTVIARYGPGRSD